MISDATIIEQIGSIPIPSVGIAGLLVGLFWMLAKGHLWTGPQVRELKEDRDHWRVAAETNSSTLKDVLEKTSLSLEILHSIEQRSAQGRSRRAGDNPDEDDDQPGSFP